MENLAQKKYALIMLLWLGFAGATHAQFSKIDFDAAANAEIKKIDVLEVVQVQKLALLPRSSHFESPSSTSRFKGAFTNTRTDQDAIMLIGQKFDDGFKRRSGSLSSEFTAQLVSALKARNFEAKILKGQQPQRLGSTHAPDYSGINASSDGVLHVIVRFAGYQDDPASSGYVPMVGIDAYLLNVKTKKVVYRQFFNQGYRLVINKDVESLPVNQQTKFATRDALGSNIEIAIDGLLQATQPVALRIAAQLAR